MYLVLYGIIFLSQFCLSEQGCDGFSRCQWTNWESWGSCSSSCGGGWRRRWRPTCCRTEHGKVVPTCLSECGLRDEDAYGYSSCGNLCYHEGHFNYQFRDKHHYGHCICSPKYSGSCCDEPLCGWDGRWCWPGRCYYKNYERFCSCDTGFRRETVGSSTMCQLTERPTLLTCRAGLEDVNGDAVNTTGTGKCSDAQSVYTNLQPHRLSFTIASSFSINVSSDPTNNRIDTWQFGIVDNRIEMVKRDVGNRSKNIGKQSFHGRPECNHEFSDRHPIQIAECKGTLLPSEKMGNGESLCVSFITFAGGFLTSKDPKTTTYKRIESSRELCFMFDNQAPEHCTGSVSCSNGLLHLNKRITESPDIDISYSSWRDPVPTGGSSNMASGIKKFVASVLRVEGLDNTTMVMKYPGNPTSTLPASSSHVKFTLPTEPALYAVLLEVHDVAGNVRMARRFVLYDNSSKVAVQHSYVLRSVTASSNTNYTWQIHHGKTCFCWKGRYYNTYHVNTNLLRQIKSDGNISSNYDQTSGLVPISGTPNIDGIVKFDYTWKQGNDTFKPYSPVSDFFGQTVCKDFNPADGQSYTFKIKPTDINSRSLTESLVVHIDRSPPNIDNVWLVKNGYRQLFVHNSSDLATMSLQFEALDVHSGLHTVQWKLGTSNGADDIGSGAIGVYRINGSCATDNCYCPNVGVCERYVYRVDLNKLVDNRTNEGQHNRNYYFTIMVTNNARLINMEHLDVLADDSPPEVGVIQEGTDSSRDTDYTSENEIHVNWNGFIDHESGIKFYRVGISEQCLSEGELDPIKDGRIIETTLQTAKFPVDHDGFFVTSIVAFNNAMEPSPVVCSDGFERDSTAPSILNVTLKHSKGMELLACDPTGPWLVRSDLRRVALLPTDKCLNRCKDSSEFKLLQNLPEIQENSTDADVSDYLCTTLLNTTDNWYIYIPSNNVDVTWESADIDSQIRDAEIGFATDPSSTTSPDLETYRDTHGHTRYHSNHEGIDRGIPFYIMIHVTNKAGIETTVPMGPIIIDDTAPLYTGGLHVNVDQNDDKVYCFWDNTTFIDTEQKHAVDYVLYRLGAGEHFYTPMLQVPPDQDCVREDYDSCVHYPLHKLQRQDEEKGLEFFFELYVFNMADHFTTVRTDTFILPSQYTPGHGTVLDIDPESGISTESLQDVDLHFSEGRICAHWSGFYHHLKLSLQIGVGTNAQKDNIIPFENVAQDKNILCMNSSALVPLQRYFVTINATCTAGSTVVSSDGVKIIDKNKIREVLSINIGTPCDDALKYVLNSQVNDSEATVQFTSPISLNMHHVYTLQSESESALQGLILLNGMWLDNVTSFGKRRFMSITDNALFSDTVLNHSTLSPPNISLLDCNEYMQMTSSPDVLPVYLTMNKILLEAGISFTGYVFEDKCLSQQEANASCLFKEGGSKFSERDFRFTIANLSLINGQAYRIGIAVCIRRSCSAFIYSKRVIVQFLPPTTDRISASLTQNLESCLTVSIDWGRFDCVKVDEVPEIYQWSMALGENAEGMLMEWVIPNVTSVQEGSVSVHECVQLPIYLHRPVYACVRVTCASGASATYCEPCTISHPNSYRIQHVYELDAQDPILQEIKDNLNAQFLGETLSQLHKSEIDFCRKDTTPFGAIPNSAERNITWYLLTDQRIPSASCENSGNCIKSLMTTGGFVTMYKAKLMPGTMYYICAWSNRTVIHRELFDDVLDEISICGNGFLVDDTPPSAGKVQIINSHQGFLRNPKTLIIKWTGFSDRPTNLPSNFSSTIKFYSYAIGTVPNGIDVVPFTNAGQSNSIKVTGVVLESGETYYATVRATDFVNYTVDAVSSPVTMDATPPTTGIINVGGVLKHRYMLSAKELVVHWNGFEDLESGLEHFYLGIGDQPGIDNILAFKEFKQQYADLSSNNFQDGLLYVATIKAVNRAGLRTTASSDPFVLDSSPPERGVVRDGHNSNDTGDVDYQNYTSSLTCHWKDFSDPQSGIQFYRVGLGTAPERFDTYMLTEVGLRTEISWKTHLEAGVKYFSTVEACNGAGLCTRHHSDGIILDDSPPIPGLVHVGISSRHETYQSHRNAISAHWIGFEDPHSDIHHFEWCLTLQPETCSILPLTNILLSNSVFKSQLSLPLNTSFFVRVVAYNNVGMYVEAISDEFKVDDTHPVLTEKPQFVLDGMQLSHKSGTQWDNSLIRLKWKFRDPDSPISKHIVKLRTHHDGGKVRKEITQVGNEDKVTIQMSEDELLMSGDRYLATVTACNAAGLCSNATTDDLLIDSTHPHLGGFKPPMTWKEAGNSSELLLTWYGFSDVESDISHYFITASRHYSGSELSNGAVRFKSEGNKEQNGSLAINANVSKENILILSIWAINGVGLRSDIGKVTVTVMKSDSSGTHGVLKLQKHSCDPHYCNNDCTCAVVGKACSKTKFAQQCANITDKINYQTIRVLSGLEEHHQNLTASSSCLSFHWLPNTDDSKIQVQRYEWSIGITKPGDGIFQGPHEKVWYDLDLHTNVTYCLPSMRHLVHDERYTMFVKAWYSDHESAVFSSRPITVDNTPPTIVRGRYIYVSIDNCASAVQFVTNTTSIQVCWRKVFKESTSDILKYELMAGTFPNGDDFIPTTDYGRETNAILRDLPLYPGTKYYFTVRAINTVGLMTALASDSLVLDDQAPFEGIMFNTDHHQNLMYQASSSSLGFSWHGFGDHHSHIHFYSVWITEVTTGQIVHEAQNVGIRTSVVFSGLTLNHKKHYQGSVMATDAAGYESALVNSQQIIVDLTPPQTFTCSNFSEVENYYDLEIGSKELLFKANLSEDNFYRLYIKVKYPIQSSIIHFSAGNHSMVLHLAENADGTKEAEFRFLSPYNEDDVQLSINFQDNIQNDSIRFTLTKCTNMELNTTESPIDVRQISPNELSICSRILDPESGIRSVQVGIGTTKGGFQVRALSTVPLQNHVVIEHNSLHGSTLYVTVLAYNHAGLLAVFEGNEVVVDHTPPEILNIIATMVTEQPGNNTKECKARIEVYTEARDNESGIKSCFCSLRLQEERAILTTLDDRWRVMCLFDDIIVSHGTTLIPKIRCINNVELLSKRVGDPLVASFQPPSISEAQVEVLPWNEISTEYTVYNMEVKETVQSNQSALQFRWSGFHDVTGIDHYRYTVANGNGQFITDKKYDTRTIVSVKGLSLTDGEKYFVSIEAVNTGGVHSDPVLTSVRVESRKPLLSGYPAKVYLNKDGANVIDWKEVFTPIPEMVAIYEINIGTREGYSDLVDRMETMATSTALQRTESNSIWISLCARYVTGKYTCYRGTLLLH